MDVTNNLPINNLTSSENRSAGAPSSSTGAEKGGETNSALGQQEFLHLLVAQMQNQDPLNPMDGTEFASQLAQFNSVEQLINLNQGLGMLQASQDAMSSSLSNSMAASLVGKQVKALSSQIWLGSGEEAAVNYRLNNSASSVEIVVRNSSGGEVRRETIEGVAAGDNLWRWDGRNGIGERMADGTYHIEVRAVNESGPVESLTFLEGVAQRVRYTGQGVFLNVNQVDVPIGDVEEVGERPTE